MNREPRQLKIIEERRMTPEMDAAIRELLCVCFPPDVDVFSKTRYWHGTAPDYSLVVEEGGCVRGHIGIVVRTVRCGNSPAQVAGIQSLAVHPNLRGCGFGQQLVVESMNEARRRKIPWGLLFCVPELERFYRNADWVVVHAAVTMKDERGRDVQIPGKNICMATCLGSVPFPEGDIHLQGADW